MAIIPANPSLENRIQSSTSQREVFLRGNSQKLLSGSKPAAQPHIFWASNQAWLWIQEQLLAGQKSTHWPQTQAIVVQKEEFLSKWPLLLATAYLVQTQLEELTFYSGRVPTPSAGKWTPCEKGCSLRAISGRSRREAEHQLHLEHSHA